MSRATQQKRGQQMKTYKVERKEYENNTRVILIECNRVDLGGMIINDEYINREYLIYKDSKKVFLLNAFGRQDIGLCGRYLYLGVRK